MCCPQWVKLTLGMCASRIRGLLELQLLCFQSSFPLTFLKAGDCQVLCTLYPCGRLGLSSELLAVVRSRFGKYRHLESEKQREISLALSLSYCTFWIFFSRLCLISRSLRNPPSAPLLFSFDTLPGNNTWSYSSSFLGPMLLEYINLQL